MNQQLEDYIKRSRQAGKQDEQIRQELLGSGWQIGDIDESLKINLAPKKTFKFPILILVALGIAVLGYFASAYYLSFYPFKQTPITTTPVPSPLENSNRSLIEKRPPNEYESMYLAISSSLKSPELCYKIFQEALLTSIEGHNNYTRSECFFEVAAQTKNADLCKEVRSLNEGGSEFDSREECIDVTTKGKYASYVGGQAQLYYPPWQTIILQKMEYDAQTIDEVVNKRNPIFYDFIETDSFKLRFNLLPDFSNN